MKKNKALILILLFILIMVGALVIYNIDKNTIISNIKYAEVQIENTNVEGLEYMDAVRIDDKNIIAKLEKIINSGVKYTPKSTAWPDISPRVTVYLENGKIYEFFATDDMGPENEEAGNYITLFEKTENGEKGKVTYKVEEKMGEYITRIYHQFSENNYVVLFNGLEINKNTGVQIFAWTNINEYNNERYNVKYYNYEKNEYIGETIGIFGKEEVYEGTSYVENVSTFAISENYNAIPRKSNLIEELPEKLNEFKGCSKVELEAIDLNGDGKNEHILCYEQLTLKNDYDVENDEIYSEILMLDSSYNKIATLASWSAEYKENSGNFTLDLNDATYIDIDNDGIMEIVLRLPVYEGYKLSVLKYSNNKLEGETDIKITIEP